MRHADCSFPSHAEVIHAAVKQVGGYPHVNDKIVERMLTWLDANKPVKTSEWGSFLNNENGNLIEELADFRKAGERYVEQNKVDLARAEFEKVFLGMEMLMGPNHLDTLVACHNLAIVATKQRQYEEAEKYYLRALESFDNLLGLEHFHTVTAVHNMALLYTEMGRLDEAKVMFERALHPRIRRPWDPTTQDDNPLLLKDARVKYLALTEKKRVEEELMRSTGGGPFLIQNALLEND